MLKIYKNILFICAAFVVIFLIVLATSNSNSTPTVVTPTTGTTSTTVTTPAKPTTTPTPKPTPKSYTLAEVSTHKNATSCWTAINGNVYDVNSWISQHPGGAMAILGTCGIDATSAFEGQHGGQRRPEQELASFKIGVLAK